MSEDAIGWLTRWWRDGADEYHVGWSDEFGWAAVCGEEEDGRVNCEQFDDGFPPRLCRNCARICRNVAEEGEG